MSQTLRPGETYYASLVCRNPADAETVQTIDQTPTFIIERCTIIDEDEFFRRQIRLFDPSDENAESRS